MPTGYRAERVLSAEVFGNFSRYQSADDFLRLYEPLLERLSHEPGVTSVAQRTQEFGLRMALGASQSAVLRGVLRQGLTLVVLGLAAGLAGAFAFGRLLQSYLFETEPGDPLTLVAVAVACLLAGTLACVGPARRATKVDPLVALRAE